MKVLLVGNGPLPRAGESCLSFPQLRTDHFLRALLSVGHTVTVVLVGSEEGDFEGEGYHGLAVRAGGGGGLERLRRLVDEFAPDVVVGAGPFEAARLATMLCGERPLWIDVPGDPFAEAQAKVPDGDDESSEEAWLGMLAAWGGALERGDAFSVISDSQANALHGQLGLLGRFRGVPASYKWVSSIPAAYGFGGLKPQAPTEVPPREMVVALTGSYNTWLDDETLLDGLLLAMDSMEGLRVISTGGGIEGFHTATWERFHLGATASRHADRFTFHGWLPHEELPEVLSRAHVGVTLDRDGVEPLLGTRTRVLFFTHQGLRVISTCRSDLTRELAAANIITPIEVGDVEGLADALRVASQSSPAQVRAAQRYMEESYSVEEISSPLLEWVANPTRSSKLSGDAMASLSGALEEARQQLDAIHSSVTWRLLGRVMGAVSRRRERE